MKTVESFFFVSYLLLLLCCKSTSAVSQHTVAEKLALAELFPVEMEGINNEQYVYHKVTDSLYYVMKYRNGIIYGTFYLKHDHGQLVMDGVKSSYSSTGKLSTSYEMSRDVIDGVFVQYHDNMRPIQIGYYMNGRLNGIYTNYYYSGRLKLQGYFEDDSRVGTWTWYYENGVIMEQGTYISIDLTDDNFMSMIKFIDNWIDERKLYLKDGVWKKYSDGGELLSTQLYEEGVLIE